MQVKSADRRFASYLIDARMMQWLLDAEGWSFELAGRQLLCYAGRLDPARYESLLRASEGFSANVPRAARDTYGAER